MRTSILFTTLLPLVLLSSCSESQSTDPVSNSPLTIFFSKSAGNFQSADLYSILSDGTEETRIQFNTGIISEQINGKMLVVAQEGSTQLLKLMDMTSDVSTTIPTKEIISTAVLSPDATMVCYGYRNFDNPTNDGWNLHVVNVDGTNDVLISDQAAHEGMVSFSPDSKRIAFYTTTTPQTQDTPDMLYISDVDGSNKQLLTNNAYSAGDNAGTVEWSRDGNYVVFTRSSGSSPGQGVQLWRIKTDGTEEQQLTTSPIVNAATARYSPDGTKIAFTGGVRFGQPNNEPDIDIWIMNQDGSDLRNLTNTASNTETEVFPRWAPNGNLILCVDYDLSDSNDPILGDLKVISVADGTVTELVGTGDVFNGYWSK